MEPTPRNVRKLEYEFSITLTCQLRCRVGVCPVDSEVTPDGSAVVSVLPLQVDNPSPNMFEFSSRRSVVHSVEGIVACTQPLAAKCGLDILRAGGNAAVRPSVTLPS
ncbi:hypothetical protein E4U47_002614 [Claviceps purpurea]|nr:hypothetical protein E4U47_002614 [Claviceps purpurea]